MQNRGLSARGKIALARTSAVLCCLLLLWLFKGLVLGSRESSAPSKATVSTANAGPQFAVLAGSTAFTDRAAAEQYLKSQEPAPAGVKYAKTLSEPLDTRLHSEGRQIKFTRDLVVRLVAEDVQCAGYCEILAANKQGVEERLWINKDFLLDEKDFDGGRVLTGFWIFRSDLMPMEVGGLEIDNLEDVISAVYSGDLPDEIATRCVFMPSLQCGVAVQKVGDYVIYRESDPQGGAELQFAMKAGDSEEPLYLAPVRYVGRQEFTTGDGTIRLIPVVAIEPTVKK